MMQGFPMVRWPVTVCVGEWGWNPVLSSEPHKLLRTRKRLIFWIPLINMKYVKFRRRSSGSSLPFIDGGVKPLKCWAAGLQKHRRQCMYEGPGMALRWWTGCPKWEREIPSKKEKVEKWLFSFPHSRCEFLYWVMIIFKNSESWYFRLSAQLLPLCPQTPHPSSASQSSGGVGAAWKWGSGSCTPLSVTPGPRVPGSFGLTSRQLCLSKTSFLALPH